VKLTILSLGAGIQSSELLCLSEEGEIPRVDYAIFADVQDEPDWVYRQLDWLREYTDIPILTPSIGRLGDDLVNGRSSTGRKDTNAGDPAKRFAAIPAFTAHTEGEPEGMTRRQCTREYKISMIERCIRREILGLEPGQRVPAGITVTQWMGFSTDEPGRAARARGRFEQGPKWNKVEFPLLFEDVWMSRSECVTSLFRRSGFDWHGSACVFCPYKSNRHWRFLRDNDPTGWKRACEVDEALRMPGSIASRNYDQSLFVHRSCVPLANAKIDDNQLPLFQMECEGGCGL